MIKIRRGLDLPINGAPEQSIYDGPQVNAVALLGDDYHGMKPTMEVKEGDQVKLGQVLFTDKKTEGVKYTSPAAGTVVAINRGERRVFQSLVIDIAATEDAVEFQPYTQDQLAGLSTEQVKENLVESGLWTALRTRPYSKVPNPADTAADIFITAVDSNPLAADPEVILKENEIDFVNGVNLLSKLAEGSVYLCTAPDSVVKRFEGGANDKVRIEEFSGIHPAGNVGTHIHYLSPVSASKSVWHIGHQDVAAIGKLFLSGKLPVERVIALAGPMVEKPRLIRTRLGARVEDLVAEQISAGKRRVVSGSVFGGRKAGGPFAYLGRYHQQLSVLVEQTEREFIHYMRAGFNRYSALPIFISSLFSLFRPGKKYDFTTTTGGSERAMVPLGSYEKVMPLDILPTQLLRALIVGDTETAQKLGCLELDEEDLALCTFVCPGKYEYGPILRDNLTRIEVEG